MTPARDPKLSFYFCLHLIKFYSIWFNLVKFGSILIPAGGLWGSLGSPGGLLGVSWGYPCLEHEFHTKVLILHWFYRQKVILSTKNINIALVL